MARDRPHETLASACIGLKSVTCWSVWSIPRPKMWRRLWISRVGRCVEMRVLRHVLRVSIDVTSSVLCYLTFPADGEHCFQMRRSPAIVRPLCVDTTSPPQRSPLYFRDWSMAPYIRNTMLRGCRMHPFLDYKAVRSSLIEP